MRKLIAPLVAATLLLASPASASPIDAVWVGKKCMPNGNTRAVVKVTNNTDQTKYPSYWYSYTDTGFVTGWEGVAAGHSANLYAVIPPGRTVAYFAIYRSPTASDPIFERKNIPALNCG